MKPTTIILLLGLSLSLIITFVTPAAAARTLHLEYVAAIQVPGSFSGFNRVWSDKDYVYAVSSDILANSVNPAYYPGSIFVIRKADWAVVQTVVVGTTLMAISGDRSYIYVTGGDGNLRTYTHSVPLTLVSTQAFPYPLSDLQLMGFKRIVLGASQAGLAVDKNRVYLSALNGADGATVLLPKGTPMSLTGVPDQTCVYDIQAGGGLIGSVDNPIDMYSGLPGPGNPYVDSTRLVLTAQRGDGIHIYDKLSLAPQVFINELFFNDAATTTMHGKDLLVGGNEGGFVELWELSPTTATSLSTVDLRVEINRFESEVVEIRSVWIDGNVIIGASSWGNDTLRATNPPPAIFILKIVAQ
jgi:hypothetical protein